MKTSNSQNKEPDFNPRQIDELIRDVVSLLDANKAEEIVTIDLQPAVGYEVRFVIASALSQAHLKKLSDEIFHMMKRDGELPGRNPNALDFESGWVILDYGNLVIHFFLPEKRDFYNLEGLWAKGTIERHNESA